MSCAQPRLLRGVATVLAAVLVLAPALAGSPASAKVPRAPHRYSAKIEPLASYVGQSTCSPAAKPGTQAFANLLLRTYRHSRSLGISRSCGVGGTSEHKEGRAFDWGVSVHSPRDRRAAQTVLRWLLKTDRHGNRYAMARRLGIQYIIWNRRIWGAYAASSGWRRYTGSNPHTDHVHFSMSWAGARKKTSFWNPRNFPHGSGSAPKPPSAPEAPSSPGGRPPAQPQPDTTRPSGTRLIPEPRAPRRLAGGTPLVHEKVSVPATVRAGARPVGTLVAGHRYLLEVSGTYRYAKRRDAFADAECSDARGSWWSRERSVRRDHWADHLDLYIDGHDLAAQPDDGGSCDDDTHTYRWVYRPERTGRAPLAVWDPTRYTDNKGALTVRITDLDAPRDELSFTVPGRAEAGSTSPGALRGGTDYLVTVRGTWTDGDGVTADAECTRADWEQTWRRDRSGDYDGDTHDLLVGRFGYDSHTPRLDDVGADPVTDDGDRCDTTTHGYTFRWSPDRTQPLHLRVDDPGRYRDNRGALRVSVRPWSESGSGDTGSGGSTPTPSPTPTPTPTPTPGPVTQEELRVDAAGSAGLRTRQSFPKGTALRVTVTGYYAIRARTDWVVADAECTATSADQTWQAVRDDSRLRGHFNGSWTALGDLAVNGRLLSWRPRDGRGDCDEQDHVYTLDLVTDRDGPLSFVVADSDYSDNKGGLDVVVAPR